GADPAVLPRPGRHVGARGVDAHDRLAPRAHDGEQGLDAVDAVPEQVRVVRLELAGAVGDAAEDLADLRVGARGLDARAEAQRRAREAWGAGLLGRAVDLQGGGQRPGHRLVDEHRLARLEHRPHLLQVRPAVHALQQDDVDFWQQRVDGIDDLDAELVAQLLGVAGDAVPAGGQVRAAAGV